MNVAKCAMVGLCALLACHAARAQEGAGDQGPRRPFGLKGQERLGREARPGLQGPGGGPRGELLMGADIPAVREEIQRHTAAMRELMAGQRGMAQQITAEVRALKDKGTQQAEIDEALKKFEPQTQEVAAKLADELTTHHGNLAKILNDNREEVVKQLAKTILTRLATRDPQQRPGPGNEGARPRPKEKGTAPENF